jgi:beta-glucosidase
VVVLNSGSAVAVPWRGKVAGLLEAWYPGQEDGNAIAPILFGDVNPSGRLPASVPVDESQVPPIATDSNENPHTEGVFVGYRAFQQRGENPGYAFGYGLSYSTFRYRRLRITGENARPQADITATFILRNTSNIAGTEVPQVYVGRLPTRVPTPPRQLAGFARVQLGPHERQTVSITIPRRSLSYWDSGAQHRVTPSGNVPVYVSSSSEDTQLAGTIHVHP